ncbi:MAG: hypothetical protein K5656_00125 [Lachnospiraceae bacterium]|nr:hypothetical protein [Lachnospiraceae bacterium]
MYKRIIAIMLLTAFVNMTAAVGGTVPKADSIANQSSDVEVVALAQKYNIPKSTVEVISNNGGFTVEVDDYIYCKDASQAVNFITEIKGYESDKHISLTCISEEMLEKYDTLKEFDPEDVEIQIVGGWVNPYIDELSIYDTDIECEITSTTLSKDDPIHEVAASGQVTIEYSPKFGEIDTYSNVMNTYKPRMYKAFTPVKKTYYIKGTYHDDKYWREHRQMLLKDVAKGEKTLSEDDTKELLTMYNNYEVYSEEDIKGMSVSI